MKKSILFLLTLTCLIASQSVRAQGTAFYYQGQLEVGGSPVTGLYDFQFQLALDPLSQNYAGFVFTTNAVPVTNGNYTVAIDFGAGVFTGANYWLEVDFKPDGATGYTAQTPDQAILPLPYAIMANSASNLLGTLPATQLTGVLPTNVLPGFQGNYLTVAGGESNTVSGEWATISGGDNNTNNGDASTISGGQNNTIMGGYQPVVGGGYGNLAIGNYATIPGGINNVASNTAATASGFENQALDNGAVVAGGGNNVASGLNSSVGGGAFNTVTMTGSAVGGGYNNINNGNYSTLAGGFANTIAADFATVGGGASNTNGGPAATIAGGADNQANANGIYATAGGGYNNFVSAYAATIAGGQNNTAGGENATVGGGVFNQALANGSTVAGGGWDGTNNIGSIASGVGSVVSGGQNNLASGVFAVVPGGANNVAGGAGSFAAGLAAQATNDGAFVFADALGGAFGSTASNQFIVRAQGGVAFVTGGAGMTLDGAPILTTASTTTTTTTGGSGFTIRGNLDGAPNIIGGASNNYEPGTVVGATISGGGATNYIGHSFSNSVTASFGTVSGGFDNIASGVAATVGGGATNTAGGNYSTVGGGANNLTSGAYATVAGGSSNLATGQYSLAAGFAARATNNGAFVWADAEGIPFGSTKTNQFSVRANGGVVFATSGAGLQVDGAPVLTAAPGSIQAYEINDGGSSAYQTFLQAVQAVGGDTSVTFSNLNSVSVTNGVTPTLALTINGAAFGTVIGFSGDEGISQPYAYVVEVNTTSAAANPDTDVGLKASLSFTRNGRTTTFGGIVTACALAASGSKSFLYTVKIESPLAVLARTTDYKIIQDKTVPDMVSVLFTGLGQTAPTTSLTATYVQHDSLTQFGETDLNFFSRLLENEGIFYFFNQGASTPTLVLGDNTSAYLSSPNSPFGYYGNTPANVPVGAEYIRAFQKATHQSTKTSTVRAYNFETPKDDLTESSSGTAGVGEYYEFGNAVASTTYDTQLAGVREGRQTMDRAAIAGSATAPDLRAGYTFTVTDNSGAGVGGNYLVTSVHHAGFVRVTNGVSTFFYGNEFEAIPAGLTYRPALKTPKPMAQPCTAVVTGPTGKEINTDTHGRVKVQFHWDRYGNNTDTSSEWMRVASPWAGSGHGMVFLPRVGDEVLVSFMEGDPDQPVITGSLYNDDANPFYALPDNQTKSWIHTSTSPGGDGFNELRFEDKSGAEEIDLQAQRDLDIKVLNDENLSITHDLKETVGNDMSLAVNGNMSLALSGNLTLSVAKTLALSGTMTLNGESVLAGNNGGSLTNLSAAQLKGPLPVALLPANLLAHTLQVTNNNTATITLNGATGAIVCSNITAGGVLLKSDRNSKENLTALDPQATLAKVSALPVTQWSYKSDPADTKHIGPMAQDFHAAFGLNGGDDTHISVIDEGGVALAAIQGLNQKLTEKEAEIKSLQEKADKVDALEKQNDALAARLNELEAAVKVLAEKK
jgi:type VI secretion system secreted protein VgrG